MMSLPPKVLRPLPEIPVSRSAHPRTAVIVAALLALACGRQASERTWTDDFSSERDALRSTGRNPYFVLEPGYQLVLEDGGEHLTITVLDETKLVDGVETRVVEERETKDDVPTEVSRNYYAISTVTNSVFYFGEEVDTYRNGTVADHAGAWLAGVGTARFGLMMPGLPLLGSRYYQEVAPGIAMDRARIVSTSDTLTTPAGVFTGVLVIEETTPLEPGTERKYYAPGVGLLQDGSLKLVRYGPPGAPR
jgi:hypothetical protein